MQIDYNRNQDQSVSSDVNITSLYPVLSTEQQSEAEYYLKRYIAIVRRIFERVSKVKDIEGSEIKEVVDNSFDKVHREG